MCELCLKSMFPILLNLFKKHEWNNLLHSYIEKIINYTFSSDSVQIKRSLLNDF